MDKKTSLALAISLAFLSGCGGGDSGPAPVKTYTIQLAALDVYDQSSVRSTCEIYGEEDVYADDAVEGDEPESTNVVVARNIRGSNLRVLIQDSSGAVQTVYTSESSNWSSTGRIVIRDPDIPDNGYVTISRQVSGSTVAVVNALSIQKSLMQNSMLVNSVFEDASTDSSGCIRAASKPAVYERTGSIDQDGDGDGVFGFSTNEGLFQSFSGQDIDFETTRTSFLAARHVRESDDNAGAIVGYRFISLGNQQDVELKDLTYSGLTWIPPQDMTSINDAELNIYRNGPGALHWQSLSTDSTGDYGYASEVGNNYYVTVDGTYNSWDVEYTSKASSPASGIDLSYDLTNSNTPSVVSSDLLSCSTSAVGQCLQLYTGAASASTQRTMVSMTNNAGQEIRQVIYSAPQALVPMMSFNNYTLDGLWSAGSLVKSEVSLLNSSDADVKKLFMEKYFDGFSVYRQEFDDKDYVDGISLVQSTYEQTRNEAELKVSPHLIFDHHETK